MGHLLPVEQGRDDDGSRVCKDDVLIVIQVVSIVFQGVGLLGAVISIVLGNSELSGHGFSLFACFVNLGFESFIYWSAFFISGFFLFTHMANLTQTMESRLPALAKIVRL